MMMKMKIFKSIFENHAEIEELLYFEKVNSNLTIDIIDKVVM